MFLARPALACDDDDNDCDGLTGDHDDHGGGSGDGSGHADETRPAKPNGTVDVNIFSGSIRVVGWNQNFVHVKGDFDHDCKLDITPAGDRTSITVECHGPPDAELELQVPQGGTLEARTMSATIDVKGVTGIVRAHSIAADIRIDGTTANEVEARSTSGSIELHVDSAYTRAHTVSGGVTMVGGHGRASVHSVSGDCELRGGGTFGEVSMQSVSGSIGFEGALAPTANVDVQSHSGDVRLVLPRTTNADVELRSFSGDLAIDMGSGRKEGSKSLEARIGNGGSRVRAHSFSGDVVVTDSKK